jgi:hypothetical protein
MSWIARLNLDHNLEPAMQLLRPVWAGWQQALWNL